MRQLTLEQANGHLQDLVTAALGGEEVILTGHGHGLVRLVPVLPTSASTEKIPHFGSAKGLIDVPDDFDAPLEDFKEYMEPGR